MKSFKAFCEMRLQARPSTNVQDITAHPPIYGRAAPGAKPGPGGLVKDVEGGYMDPGRPKQLWDPTKQKYVKSFEVTTEKKPPVKTSSPLSTSVTKFGQRIKESNERSWVGIPFREVTGDKPKSTDVPPQRTREGDFVFYHGTSRTRAAAIMRERYIRPDNLGVVGVATVPGQASVFAIMKGVHDEETPRTGTVLRVVIDKDWLGKQHVTREVGGSGHDQFLIQPPGDMRGWPGVPVKAVRKR